MLKSIETTTFFFKKGALILFCPQCAKQQQQLHWKIVSLEKLIGGKNFNNLFIFYKCIAVIKFQNGKMFEK